MSRTAAATCANELPLVLSTAAVILYLVAYALGVRQWRCWAKPPWVVIFYAGIAALQTYLLFWHPAHTQFCEKNRLADSLLSNPYETTGIMMLR
jgi:hypothetical protein